MVALSKFLTGKRGSQQLLDTDGYTCNQRKDRKTGRLSAVNDLTLSKCVNFNVETIKQVFANLKELLTFINSKSKY